MTRILSTPVLFMTRLNEPKHSHLSNNVQKPSLSTDRVLLQIRFLWLFSFAVYHETQTLGVERDDEVTHERQLWTHGAAWYLPSRLCIPAVFVKKGWNCVTPSNLHQHVVLYNEMLERASGWRPSDRWEKSCESHEKRHRPRSTGQSVSCPRRRGGEVYSGITLVSWPWSKC